jgi:hypothetical protein
LPSFPGSIHPIFHPIRLPPYLRSH